MTIKLSAHVKAEIVRRQLSEELVFQVARNPQQTLPARDGLECRQSIFNDSISGKEYLLRVIVNPLKSPNLIVTTYKTSKVSKYWRD